MSLELSKCGMGSDISVKFGEILSMGSMISLEEEEEEEERKKERKNSSDYNRVAARTLITENTVMLMKSRILHPHIFKNRI